METIFYIIASKYNDTWLSEPIEVTVGNYIKCSNDEKIIFISEEQANNYFERERQNFYNHQNRVDNL